MHKTPTWKRASAIIICLFMTLIMLSGCGRDKQEEIILPDEDGWFSIWSAAPQLADESILPTSPGLKGNTCRQVIRASIGGDKIKLTFSNEYGTIPLVLDSVHIAKLLYEGNPSILPDTDTVVTFNGGKSSVTIAEGKTVTSDEIRFSFEALESLAVSVKVGDYNGGSITGHANANTASWIVSGDRTGDEDLIGFKYMASWYYLVGAQTYAKAGTKVAVAIGDSLTDRKGTTFSAYKGWTDQLDSLLKSNPKTKNISLINMALADSSISKDENSSILTRLERDVFSVPGVRYCIVFIGMNDIGSAQADISEAMISDYKKLIQLCHERGIKVFACTITPVKGNFFYSELHEKIRKAVNKFITSEDSGFDGVFTFATVIAKDDDRSQMKEEYTSQDKDYLHPGDLGCQVMAEEAYAKLTEFLEQAELKAKQSEQK